MIHIKQAIVVEGKYDKIKLSSIVDAVILVTNGFQIYKNPEQLDLIRYYARTTGVILMTDADRAGFQIRNYLKGAIQQGTVYQVYTPDVYGKEHRKEKPSAEGKLGVEGIRKELLLAALERAGVLAEETAPKNPEEQITAYDQRPPQSLAETIGSAGSDVYHIATGSPQHHVYQRRIFSDDGTACISIFHLYWKEVQNCF